jgi:glycosyltransferase involved in cell wall biosynthesis
MDKPETNKAFFTIVMPAYGVEKYIDRAILSIQKQTFTNWELIVVDDCTKDKSGLIAGEYEKKDSRINVIRHEVNKGLSAARNTGIKAAKGTYIWFMDPDDYADERLLEQVYHSIELNAAQVILFGHVEEYYNKRGVLQYTNSLCPKEHYFHTAEELRPYIIKLEQDTLYGYAWNKFYLVSYIREIRMEYENVKLIEDIVFNIKYFMDIETMNILPITPYHYGKRMEANLTNKFVPEYFALHKQRIEMLSEQFSYWNILTDEVRSTLGSLYARYILSALERNCNKESGMNHAQRYKWCREVFAQGVFRELIPSARAKNSLALRLSLGLFRRKKVILCLMMGRTIYIVRKCMPMIYSKVKTGR